MPYIMSANQSAPVILTTSLNEIVSFAPCNTGWRKIRAARKTFYNTDMLTDEQYAEQFPLVDCLNSNPINDVLWLIGKREEEIQIAVRFAQMCADSVKHLNNENSKRISRIAIAVALFAANANAGADAAAAAKAAGCAAETVVSAAAKAANNYTNGYAAAYSKQKKLNKQFLIQCINEFQY